MGIDDVVAELELDVLDFAGYLELLDQLYLCGCLWRNGVLLRCGRPSDGPCLTSWSSLC
jgi:hypothetical protein